MAGSGHTIIAPGATLSMLQYQALHNLQRVLQNDGVAVWSDGVLRFENGTLQNNGTFYAVADFSDRDWIGDAGTNYFNNAGVLIKQGSGAMKSSAASALFNNSGELRVEAGTFNQWGGGVNTGSIVLDALATFKIQSLPFTMGTDATVVGAGLISVLGTLDVTDTVSIPRLSLAGNITGNGNLSVTELLDWTGGAMSGSGRTIIAPGATLSLRSNNHGIGRVLQNEGMTIWSSGELKFTNGVFQNDSTFIASSDTTLYASTISGVNAFNNAGTFTNLGKGTVLFLLNGPKLNNIGTLDGQVGSITIDSGGTHGPQSVFAGSVDLHGGISVLDGMITVAGQLYLSQSVVANTPVAFSGAGIVILSGSLSGSADITFKTTLNWVGGEMLGTGRTIIASGFAMNITGPSHSLGRTLQNDGSVTWSAGVLSMKGGTFQNNANVVCVGGLNSFGDGGINAFNNAGTFTNLGNSIVQFRVNNGSGVPFNNFGVINGQISEIQLNAGGTHSPSAIFAGAETLGGGAHVLSATTNVTGALSIATPIKIDTPVTFFGPGQIILSNTISGNADVTFNMPLNWTSGLMSGAGKTIISPGGKLILSGSGHNLNRELQNNGVTEWRSGDLQMNGGTFQNIGSFVADPTKSFFSYGTGGVNRFDNAGIFQGGVVRFYENAGSGVAFNNLSTGTASGLLIYAGGVQGDGATFTGLVEIAMVPVTFGATTNILGSLGVGTPWTITTPTAFNGPGELTIAAVTNIAAGGSLIGNSPIRLVSIINSESEIVWARPVSITYGQKGTINAPARLTTFSVDGVLDGTGDITVLGSIAWSGAAMNGTGKTIVAPGASMTISGAAQQLNRVLQNDGFINWGYGALTLSANVLNNGTFTASSPNDLIVSKGNGSPTFLNTGVFIKHGTGAAQFQNGVPFVNQGTVDIEFGPLIFGDALSNSAQGALIGSSAGQLALQRDLLGDTTNAEQVDNLGAVRFDGAGTALIPQLLEAQSNDLGSTSVGFAHNFAFNTLALSGATYVKLVDQSNNAAGAGPEAVYVDLLVVPIGVTLDLNGLNLYARSIQVAGTILNGQVTQFLPTVIQVLIGSSAWTPLFLNQLQTAGLGSGGYAIPGNAIDQLSPLPWSNLNQIKIAFNQGVNVQSDSLMVFSAVSGPLIPIDFAYDAVSHVATWTLAQPVGNDRMTLSLAASGLAAVTDSDGVALDGDWPGSADGFPSGNGSAGGDFEFALSVLPGDVSHDGVVNIQDLTNVAEFWLQAAPMSDANGDGKVDIQEITLIATNWLTTNLEDGGGGEATGRHDASLDESIAPTPTITSTTESLPDSAPKSMLFVTSADDAFEPATIAAPTRVDTAAPTVALPQWLVAPPRTLLANVQSPDTAQPFQPRQGLSPLPLIDTDASFGATRAAVKNGVIYDDPPAPRTAAIDMVFATTEIHSAFHRREDYSSIALGMLSAAPKPVGKCAFKAGGRQG